MSSKTIIVVGAGMGGLTAALRLAAAGHTVKLFDKGSAPGGKARNVTLGGHTIGVGPTVMTMDWVFRELCRDVDADFDALTQLSRLPELGYHRWPDGTSLTLGFDETENARRVLDFSDRRNADGYKRFTKYAREILSFAREPFITSAKPTLARMMGPMGVMGAKRLLKLDGLRSMWTALGGFFRDVRLQQLFGRYATYCGSSPFQAPATLNLIAAVEFEGVWQPRGGIAGLAHRIFDAAVDRGLEAHFETNVEAFDYEASGKVAGIVVNGERIDSDAVVFNGDVAALGKGALGEPARKALPEQSAPRSFSAATFSFVHDGSRLPSTHNVFFSESSTEEFAQLERGHLPLIPTVYAHTPEATPGVSGYPVFCIANAPADADRRAYSDEDRRIALARIIASMHANGFDANPTDERLELPPDFDSAFPGSGGAIYGSVTHRWKSPLHRPQAASRIPGLFLAGGSVHPGAGVPMASLSGSFAAQAVGEYLR